jgi:sodium-dependent dicarboxylate transporter 2/3/5
MQALNPAALVAGISSIVVFLTEVTSNTATSQILLPVVASVARQIEINPLLLMLPVTLSASMAFMMPVATPPNAIVFASGQLLIRDMIKTGFIINIIAIIVITLLTWFVGRAVFDIDITTMPLWAR